MNQMPIRWKITILSYAVVIFSLLIGGMVVIANIQEQEEKELRIRSMNTARTVAELSDVKNGILQPQGWKTVNKVAEEIRIINEKRLYRNHEYGAYPLFPSGQGTDRPAICR